MHAYNVHYLYINQPNSNVGCKYLENLPNINMLISLLLLIALVSGITSEYVPCDEDKSEDEKPEDPR